MEFLNYPVARGIVRVGRAREARLRNGVGGLERATEREFPQGVRDQGLKLISGNGSQPTSVSFMREMATLGIEQILTSYYNPKGNAETERMLRTIKEEVIWLNEFSIFDETKEEID